MALFVQVAARIIAMKLQVLIYTSVRKEMVFHYSSFEVHEQGFATLCEIAQLSIDKPDAETPLFRTRYGYSPVP